jgi:amidase
MPGGSSTGSAVGVAAGYSPLALGTESDGSTIQPANRASLFALKPTHGIISLDGVWKLSNSFDVIGCMAKSSSDLANLLDVLVESDSSDYPAYLTGSFKGLKLGFVDPDIWRFPEGYAAPVGRSREQMVSPYPHSNLSHFEY